MERRYWQDILASPLLEQCGHAERADECPLSREERNRLDWRSPRADPNFTMSSTFAGQYPIEHRKGEIERLEAQGQSFAPDARTMLELIGVQPGWACLDLGCGPRGITDIMSACVGPTGRVVGLDKDEGFLAYASAHARGNVEFRRGDAYASGLPAATFDLVHMRFIGSTAGNPEGLLREAIRLVRPGGVVALQEPDADTYACYPPHPAWDRLMTAMLGAFTGSDLYLARRLYRIARDAGLTDVHYRPVLIGIRSTDPMIDHLPSTVESLRSTILKLGLLSEAEFPVLLEQCRNHLRDPGTVLRSFTVAQVWGRKQV
jgi:SAM-dependent methyltransferase